MEFLPTQKEDLPRIMEIVNEAQQYLASLNIDQWQDNYPNEETILNDIDKKQSFVIKDDGVVIGTTVFTTEEDLNYRKVEGGEWLTLKDNLYGVIHRIAVSNVYRSKGFAKFVFNHCEGLLIEQGVESMRIDTHRDNLGMQALVKALGYAYCGVIYLARGGDERLAFEKILK
jgi:ribosomal protein S18 acetylase RimI-like enzyme